MTEIDVYALASEGRDLAAEIRAAGSDPTLRNEDGPLRDGDMRAEDVAARSLSSEWDRAFAHAKRLKNSNKASVLYADAHFEEFREEGSNARN
jgi:hypothetical protein